MAWVVWGAVVALAVLHQDFWFWGDRTLVLGFIPIGLAYHAAISALAGVAWALVVKFAWPAELEEWAARGPAPIEGPVEEPFDTD